MKSLAGTRIITVESLAPELCGMMLVADLGAEGIEIEQGEAGDDLSRTTAEIDLGPIDRTADAVVNNLRGNKRLMQSTAPRPSADSEALLANGARA